MGGTGYQPVPWRLNIYEPQRGSVPEPNVVPRLRDYVGLPTRRQPQRDCGYFRARVDHYLSIGFARMRSSGAMGHNPVGVDISFVPSPQGRRFAPTLGSVSERRWRSQLSKPDKTSKPQGAGYQAVPTGH